MDNTDWDKGFVEMRQTSKETTFSVCKYCLPEEVDRDAMVKSANNHGITIIFLSCDKHNPYVFDE